MLVEYKREGVFLPEPFLVPTVKVETEYWHSENVNPPKIALIETVAIYTHGVFCGWVINQNN